MKNHDDLSVYVHIPYCLSKCDYCGFYSVPLADNNPEPILQAIIAELDNYQLQQPAATLYIGGGSPSCLDSRFLLWLVDALLERLGTPEEFTIEMNPGQVDGDVLAKLRAKGVNRLSMGAQSFIDSQLQLLGRTYAADDIIKAVQVAKSAGFDNISLDTIFALPGQTLEHWQYNLEKLVSLDIQHISAYSLSYEPNTVFFDKLQQGKIIAAEAELDLQMYKLTVDYLAQAGFGQYETSNFARPGFACQHNMTYWQGREYIGLGPGASSFYDMAHKDNHKNINRYIEEIKNNGFAVEHSETIDALQYACQVAVLNMRLVDGIEVEKFYDLTGYDPMKIFVEPIEKYRKLNLLVGDERQIKLTREGMILADTIMVDFILY